MSSSKKIRNWKEYNASLERRGEIIINITESYYKKLYYCGIQKKGGIKRYNHEMFELISTIQVCLRMSLRSSVGFARALLKKLFNEDRGVVNFGHASRMLSKLNFKIRRHTKLTRGIVLSFDSTGVSVHSTSGWHQRKHGGQKRLNANERWKKLHLAIDLKSGEILSCKLTDSNRNDNEVVSDIIDELKSNTNIEQIIGDGAYDTYQLYEIATKLGAKVLVPTSTTSKAQDELVKPRKKLDYLKQRDDIIHYIRKFDSFEEGRKVWKKESGYHQRSKVETAIFRFKKICGFDLRNKNFNSRLNEVISKINCLNDMIALGKAQYIG